MANTSGSGFIIKVDSSGEEVKENSRGEDIDAANMEVSYSLNSYVHDAVQYFREGRKEDDKIRYILERPYKLFVDLSYSYKIRLDNIKYMAEKGDDMIDALYSRLSWSFERFYTKKDVYKHTFRGHVVRTVSVILTFAGIGLFQTCRRKAYSDADVNITYVLLCCTATLEFFSAWLKPLEPCFLWMMTGRMSWPDDVSQYNLIWYLASKRENWLLRKLAFLVGCEDRLDRVRCMKACKGKGITKLIYDHIVSAGWKKAITNAITYREFNDNRGQLTVRTYLSKTERREKPRIQRSIRRPFDESVLLWHLATNFCYYKTDKSSTSTQPVKDCGEMSNYMAYLLFVHPEMLIPGARHSIFKAACRELEEIMPDENLPQGGQREDKVANLIIKKMDGMLACKREGTHFVHQAWALAEELLILRQEKGEETMWKVIQGVWVEMLCFSASRSRGFLHAESLGKGGQYLTCVWLLMWYMGMETFAVRLQRTTNPNEEGDMSADVVGNPAGEDKDKQKISDKVSSPPVTESLSKSAVNPVTQIPNKASSPRENQDTESLANPGVKTETKIDIAAIFSIDESEAPVLSVEANSDDAA